MFEIYLDRSGYYRWRLKATNGQIIADSGEGYSSRRACDAGIDLVRKLAPIATIKVLVT